MKIFNSHKTEEPKASNHQRHCQWSNFYTLSRIPIDTNFTSILMVSSNSLTPLLPLPFPCLTHRALYPFAKPICNLDKSLPFLFDSNWATTFNSKFSMIKSGPFKPLHLHLQQPDLPPPPTLSLSLSLSPPSSLMTLKKNPQIQ